MKAAVIEFAERAALSPDKKLAEAGRRAQDRLRERLRVAVVGRQSAGKSTLLNALLERAISPTAGGECTQVVYVFRHDLWTTAVAHPRDGAQPVPVGFEGTALPTSLPISAARLRYVEVTLPAAWLDQATLIDTPGLASTSIEKSELTTRLLTDSEDAAAAADALLFCVNGPIKDDEAVAVRAFRASRGGSRLTRGTAVGVLTKVDALGDRRTAWKKGIDLSRQMSTTNADLFSTVLPVMGLLAQTATTGALRAQHVRALKTLAQEWAPDTGDVYLLDHRMFIERARTSLTPAERHELVELLGTFGIGELLEALRAGVPANATSLTAAIRRLSGFDMMSRQLQIALGARADVLKAAAALEDLIARAREAGEHAIHDRAQTLLDRREMFPLRVIELAQLLSQGRVRPPAGLAEEAWIVVTTGLPQVSAGEAMRGTAAWREWATLTDNAGQAVARIMVRAWQLAADGGGTHA